MTTTASEATGTPQRAESKPGEQLTERSVESGGTRQDRWLAIALALALSALTLMRLSSYGIWDPWELTVADAARKLAEGAGSPHNSAVGLWLVKTSFALFGTREWAGRLPIALLGLLFVLVTSLWVKRYAGTRNALYSALAIGTTPLFMLHSREMVGATPIFFCSALIAIGASNAVFVPAHGEEPAYAPWAWLGLAGLASVLGLYTGGALVTVVPPLVAVTAAAFLLGLPFDGASPAARRYAAFTVLALTLLVGIATARALIHHGAEFSVWTGGTPLDESVPTFERVIAQLFHGLAPWSAAAPLALGVLFWRDDLVSADAPLRLVCLVWATLAFATTTIYLSAFGGVAYSAPAAITILVALWFASLERRRDRFGPELVIALLMLGLIIRDYALYPSSPFDALGLHNATAPDKFNPKGIWAGVFGCFALGLVLSSLAVGERAPFSARAPYEGLRVLWGRSIGHRGWLLAAAALWLGLVVFGLLSVANIPGVKLTSLARRIGIIIGAIALLAPLALVVAQWLYVQTRRLEPVRNLPLALAALLVGMYASQGFLPRLSAHLSPREVFDVFERLAGPKEPLAQHQVHGRAASYYVAREVKDIDSESDLVTYLAAPERHWALLPSDRLADVDVAFRRRTGRHLFVPNAENARVSLVASLPVPGQADENPLSKYVLKTVPTVEHPVGANFDGKIELVGYDLELPQKDYVGPGQTFTVTWIFRVLAGNLGTYQSFLHVDAEGQRINGDHDPVDGMYPVRLWDLGDVVVDRQKVSVPATTPPGTYTMYMGFFRGESRLKVIAGPKDDADRVIAGKLMIR